MPTLSEENPTGVTRLEWSDEDDDFFSEDGKENTDDGFDDDFDIDADLGITPDGEKTDDTNSPNVETTSPPDDDFDVDADLGITPNGEKTDGTNSPNVETTSLPDDTAMETISALNECGNGIGDFQSLPATTALTNSQTSPNPVPFHDSSPSPGSKQTRGKEETLSTSNIDSSVDSKGPKACATIAGPKDSSSGPVPVHGTPFSKLGAMATPILPVPVHDTPFSQLGAIATPLVELKDEDEKFEEIVRKRNRVRKEREDYHIAHIKVQMGRLEDALAAETKRRVDATTALDELARTQVHEMEERVCGQLREENEKLQSRLGALEERVRLLEENWITDSNNQIELVNSKAADLSKSIAQIRDDQNMERKARLKREGILLQQVEGHAKEAEERWTAEHNDRVQRLKELEDQIIRNEARLALEQKRHEDRIDTELTALKQELEIEVAERQTQDEEIVAALNRYTQQLQQSLSILSSD